MSQKQAPPPSLPIGPQALLAVLGFLMYASTLLNGYALDDKMVLSENKHVQRGFAGIMDIFSKDSFSGYLGDNASVVSGGRYRPLSLATFAAEVGIFGPGHPWLSHFINAVLFALTAVLLLRLLVRLIPLESGKPIWTSVAFMATALFVVHPLHTEAVANIKGRDEVLALLLGLGATLQGLKFLRGRSWLAFNLALVLSFLSLLSKESALPFLLAIPLLGLLAHKDRRKDIFFLGVGLALVSALYLLDRTLVTQRTAGGSPELMNNPFLHASMGERVATSLLCMGKYLQLLVLPFPLTHDYYPNQVAITGWGNVWVILSLLLHLGLAALGVLGIRRGKAYGWAAIWYLAFLLPVSNLLVNTGVLMAERFTYLPSVGAVVLMALGIRALAKALEGMRKGGGYSPQAALLVLPLFGFTLLTQIRNPVWKDDFTLFTTDAKTSTQSARAQMVAGGAYLNAARDNSNAARRIFLLDASLEHLDKALKLYPDYANAWVLKGNAIMERTGDIARAKACYEKALSLQEIPEARRNLQNLGQAAMGRVTEQDTEKYLERTRLYPDDPEAWYQLGMHHQRLNNVSASREALEKALELDPDNAKAMGEIGVMLGQHYQDLSGSIRMLGTAIGLPGGQMEHFYKNLGVAYGMSKDFANSERVLKEGLVLYPKSEMLHQTLAATYEQQGRLDEARAEMQWVSQPPR